MLADIAAEHRRGRRLLVATTNLDAGRRVVWNMGAIAERGDARALKLFRDVLLASCAIPGFFSPVAIDVEGNGKKLQELHGDGTLTAPFFVVPEAIFSPTAKVRPSISDLYVIINSKFESDFKMTDRMVAGVLGRSIDLALTSALRAQSMLLATAAQRHGISLRIAYLPATIDLQSRGPFDGRYMKALFEVGIEQGLSGAAFASTLPDLQVRKSNSAQ
jgi:predicted acylesterase/phospholipase RssA